MSLSKTWQLEVGAARRYEEVLVPVILGPFARSLVDEAKPAIGEVVLDVGCGTGAAARRAAEAVGETGTVVAADINSAMVGVARSLPPPGGAPIEWLEAPAEHLPLPSAFVDLVLCAQTLQFVQDRELTLREMRRVARPGARVAIGVWCALRDNPYFAAVWQALAHLSADAPSALLAAFSLSDPADLRRLLARAGFPEPTLSVREIMLELPALEVFLPLHLASTPVAELFEEAPVADQARVVASAREVLSSFGTGTTARTPFRSWFAIARV